MTSCRAPAGRINSGPGAPLTTTAAPATTVEQLVLHALCGGPRTSSQVVAGVETESPGTFAGREGLVFPLLLALRRRGLVASAWADTIAGRRNVYRLADDEPGAYEGVRSALSSPPPAVSPQPLIGEERVDLTPAVVANASARLADAADRATRRLAFAPRLREEFRVDVLDHLRESAAERAAAGARGADAEKQAVRALGDPWKIGIDLARTAQGRRTVIFPASARDSLKGIAIYDLRVLLVILAGIVFVRVQVITAYHIPTKSMEPTLHGDPRHGDRILVNKLSGTPKRFDITVFDGFDSDRKNFVKRCVGLPGEKLTLGEGDLWIDDQLVGKSEC